MRKLNLFFVFILLLGLLVSCNSTKVLTDNQYMLTKNTVTVLDAKGQEIPDLTGYLRPVPNNKFMGVFNLKTSAYASGQPKVKKNGEVKDTKFRKWMRTSVGEAPVLLDSLQLEVSEKNLVRAVGKLGYFNAEASSEVVFPEKQDKKAYVNYYVKLNDPYYIRRVSLDVSVPEFKKILVLSMSNSLVKTRTRYDEDLVSQEIIRMVHLLHNHGYYNVNSSIFYCEVDTLGSTIHLDEQGHRTLRLKFVLNVPDSTQMEKYLYRYYFNDVTVYTNYDIANPESVQYDTATFYSFRDKSDSTTYKFLVPKVKNRYRKNGKLKKDFKYRTITDVIYSKYGTMYTYDVDKRSKKGLTSLNNFSSIDVVFTEDESKRDTINRIGYLNSTYKLVRQKVHSISGQVDVRTDKSGLSFTYGNKNIFKGAENFSINVYGNYFYYSKQYRYPEFGVNLTLDFPRLFLFKWTQDPDALKYKTALKFGMNYSGLYMRWMYDASYAYDWSPDQYVNHVVTPVAVKTLDADESRTILSVENYEESYRQRFGKDFLLSFKYAFNYLVPLKRKTANQNMRLTLAFESCGLFLTGLNAIFSPNEVWKIGKYNYPVFEAIEFTMKYNYIFNDNNQFAMRINTGAMIPILKGGVIPYESGYYLGGSNSMRAFPFRGVGPGSQANPNHNEYTGDIKLEINLEYRGTIYKSFKYGVFVDAGNVWLANKYEGMEAAQFDFRRFYKELALCAGVGLRFDFNFFIIRLDYAIPVYDPRAKNYGAWINSRWLEGETKTDKIWYWGQGFKFAIGYAF